MSTTVWIVEGNHQEKWIVTGRVQELPHKKLDFRDVPANLVDGMCLFRLLVVELEDVRWPDVLFADQTGLDFVFSQYRRETLHVIEGIEMIFGLVQTVHTILMGWLSGKDRSPAWGTRTDRCERLVEDQTPLSKCVDVRSLDDFVQISSTFEARIVG